MADSADDRLAARVHVHMLDRYVLLALPPFPRQSFDLHGVGAHEFGRQVAEDIQPFDAVTLVSMACNSTACASDQFEQDNVRHSHVRCEHCFDSSEWSPVAFSKPLSIQRTNCRERVPNASASR
jgi:hypothetical protein